MLGRSHALCGLTFGATVAAALPEAPLPVRLLVIPIAGGSALLPDIDKPGSRVARSLGPITWLISKMVAWTAEEVYLATRTAKDSKYTNGGHRRLSHTVPGCVLFGGLAAAAFLHPIAAAVMLGLLSGLLLGVVPQVVRFICWVLWQFHIRSRRNEVRLVLFAAVAATSWIAVHEQMDWWWIWPLVVAGGCFVHILGDTVTSSGTPMLWPITRGGKRWGNLRTWIYFDTGSPYERGPVTRRLWVTFVVSLMFAAGIAQPLLAAVYRSAWVTG